MSGLCSGWLFKIVCNASGNAFNTHCSIAKRASHFKRRAYARVLYLPLKMGEGGGDRASAPAFCRILEDLRNGDPMLCISRRGLTNILRSVYKRSLNKGTATPL